MAIRQPALPKHPDDRAQYRIPFDPWLCEESLLSNVVSVVSDDPNLVVTDIGLHNNTTVRYTLSGGVAPSDVDVTVIVETTRQLPGGPLERLARVFPVQVRA